MKMVEAMSREVVSLRPEDSIQEAARLRGATPCGVRPAGRQEVPTMLKLTAVNTWLHVALVLALVLAVTSVGSLGWLQDAFHRQSVETWQRLYRGALQTAAVSPPRMGGLGERRQ